MIKIDKNSIAIKLAKVMFVLIIFQAVAIMGIIIATGVITNLQNNAYSAFDSKIANRKNYVETELNLRYSNISSYVKKVNEVYDSIADEKGRLAEENVNVFLDSVAPEIIEMLRSSMTTGAYVILENAADDDITHPVLYIRDTDPALSDESNKDLYFQVGPVEIARKLQIPLEKSWTYEIELNDDIKNIFYMPYNAAEKATNVKLFGYWDVVPSISGNNVKMITYTLPLINEEGNAYGVLGVDIVQDYFYRSLPGDELSENGSIGYILAYKGEDNIIMPAMTHGATLGNIAPYDVPMELKMKNEPNQVYNIESSKETFPVVEHMQPIKLYNNNTPFESTQWLLVGINSQAGLLQFTNGIMAALIIAVITAILIAMIAVVFVGRSFAKPIVSLANKVKLSNSNGVVALEEIGISEIDYLSKAIIKLNKNVLEVASKTDNVIKMTGLPLGTFEYKKGTEFVFCSDGVAEMLGLVQEKNVIDRVIFFERLEIIKSDVEDAENNIYMINETPIRYLRIVTKENEISVLGAVMDTTREVIDRHSIKFERDYDALTGLLNRFAFKRKTLKHIQIGFDGIAALLMFDLDNLKYINDTYGHDAGDLYIREAARGIYKYLHKKAVVGRMSGDEFYVFLYGFENKQQVRDLINELYESFDYNKFLLPNGTHFKIRMSGGISWYGEDSKNIDELTRYADFAMYKGKHSVKGELREFDKVIYESESFMLSGREELNNILDNQLIEYAFQPIVCLKTGDIYAYESLLRPISDVLTSPLKLIQIATAQSKLWQIEKITFYKTLSSYAKFKDMFKGCKIFINSVPNQILKEEEYEEIEKRYSGFLDKVVIEIIENEKHDVDILTYKKDLVKKWGGALALDDYGSGYNGDLSLLNMAPEIVKIDKFMIEGIERDTSRQSIVQKLLVYAKEHNILVVAEGVETESQFEYLVCMGVDLVQGYYVAHPGFIPGFDNTKIKNQILEIRKRNNLD